MSNVSSLNRALSKIIDNTDSVYDQGISFEKLCKLYFENDKIQKQEYEKVWRFKDWVLDHKEIYPTFKTTDTGIDLVAKLRNSNKFASIQCKFYQENASVTKTDLDKFISMSSSRIFERLVLIDTTINDLSIN